MSGNTEALVSRWVTRQDGLGEPISIVLMSRGPGSQVYRVELDRGCTSGSAIVVRVYTNREWLAREPNLPSREFAMLRLASVEGLPAPRPLGIGHGDPPMVSMSFMRGESLTGRSLTKPIVAAIAEMAKRIHGVKLPPHMECAVPRYAPHYLGSRIEMTPPSWSLERRMWERAIALYQRFKPSESNSLLHRDLHYGNILCEGGAISAVVDWTTACFGNPAADIAHMRWNLLLSHGEEEMTFFSRYHREISGSAHDPSFDIYAVVGALPDLPALSEKQTSRLEQFVRRALSDIEG